MTIDVLKPGLFSTFQDLGRAGYQDLGVPVGGAMDEVAHRTANLLVGNDEAEATLEITLLGPTLAFGDGAWIALCGADLGAVVVLPRGHPDGVAVPLERPIRLAAGSVLRFGARRFGLRTYLAARGGFDVVPVMGSRSTHVRSGIGGLDGRTLRKGDAFATRHTDAAPPRVPLPRAVDPLLEALRRPGNDAPIRVTPGREWDRFAPEAQAALVSQPMIVGPQSDRMGLRLQGPPLPIAVAGDMLSEAVAFGTVQVPPDGSPVVLMADRQSSGGYPRIAQVATVDLPRLAQLMPGESFRFERIDHATAQRLLLRRASTLDALRAALRGVSSPESGVRDA